MAKYFSGITVNSNRYNISIIDDNLNIIFMDSLQVDRLVELLKRKSVTVMSVDAPLALYAKNAHAVAAKDADKLVLKMRTFDNILRSKKLFTYNSRFNIHKDTLESFVTLYKHLNSLGFNIKNTGDTERCIIESYPDTSLMALGCQCSLYSTEEDELKVKLDFLKNKGMRIKDYFKKSREDSNLEINTLCQAYTAYSYYSGDATCMSTPGEGLLVIPSKKLFDKAKVFNKFNKAAKLNPSNLRRTAAKNTRTGDSSERLTKQDDKIKMNSRAIVEYCGAQYLYTNTDGVIRINDLRPIKSYRPFTEIYEIKRIKLVQVIIGTTDGLRRVKANLIPNSENSNSFKAAAEEDKKKLDNFWGNRGDKRGYLIKFNRVEVVKS